MKVVRSSREPREVLRNLGVAITLLAQELGNFTL